jgi:hypothetical protein
MHHAVVPEILFVYKKIGGENAVPSVPLGRGQMPKKKPCHF